MAVGLDKVKPDAIKEEKQLVVEGMDISGHWNRMFEQRVIWDYDLRQLDRVTDLPGGESLGWCYGCAKCTGVCPVDIVGDYSPRKIHRKTQMGIDLLSSPDLWLCTTCRNCLRVCPKEVDMIQIMPAVREQAVLAGSVPAELQKAFEDTAKHGNPLGQPQRKRADWVKQAGVPVPLLRELKRPVELLWYVGSYPSYHPRGNDAARAAARIFHALGLDFGILGVEEKDDGDSQRLAGEKGLFEMLAEANIAAFEKYPWNRMVVTGPHEFNAFKNEYPKLGFSRPIVHYTRLLVEHLEQLRPLLTKPVNLKVTFHDPCYLGRHNGEYEAPRDLLRAIPGVELIEMGRCRANGYCCGGGGGGMWLDSFTKAHTTMRLSERRVREAVEYGADVLAVCCPFEVSRFEDAAKSTGNDRLIVRDILELLDESMGGSQ
ncbi:MAG: 4Fe-4S dicluster domain-containing protein [Anaerolineales bacterium]|nr:4Fe-4S dicluster domain-containing protein [Anaerolineales bacterium]